MPASATVLILRAAATHLIGVLCSVRAYQTEESSPIVPFEYSYPAMMVVDDVALWVTGRTSRRCSACSDQARRRLRRLAHGPPAAAAQAMRARHVHPADSRGGMAFDQSLEPEAGLCKGPSCITDHSIYSLDACQEPRFMPGAARLLPRFVTGALARPAGGFRWVPGFEAFREAMADPNHPGHAEMLDRWWFDVEDIEEEIVRTQLDRLARDQEAAVVSDDAVPHSTVWPTAINAIPIGPSGDAEAEDRGAGWPRRPDLPIAP